MEVLASHEVTINPDFVLGTMRSSLLPWYPMWRRPPPNRCTWRLWPFWPRRWEPITPTSKPSLATLSPSSGRLWRPTKPINSRLIPWLNTCWPRWGWLEGPDQGSPPAIAGAPPVGRPAAVLQLNGPPPVPPAGYIPVLQPSP